MKRKRTVTFDLIECAAGWQAECSLGDWTCYSKVYRDIDETRVAAEAFARDNGWSFYSIKEPQTPQGLPQ